MPVHTSKKAIKKNDANPLAVNIIKLQRYNFKFFSLEEVVMFEYLIVKARAFKFKEFYHSSATIEKETGIKKSKLNSILHRFKRIKILNITVKGRPQVKYFKVDFKKIYSLLNKIYGNEKEKPFAEIRKLLTDFYKPLAENSLEKNNKRIHSKRIEESF